mmetsp:Transcript_25995/g.72806  ORF Transcript_25995/g.72806 Transcript_25995/m.72806 type:complete len:275 (+) Transcript_25995:90-914(+)
MADGRMDVELQLCGQASVRGDRRAKIKRKQALRELRKLRRDERCEKQREDEESRMGATDDESTTIIMEVVLEPDPRSFLPSPQEEYWDRNGDKEYHLNKLLDDDCILGRRVALWEDMREQPQRVVRCDKDQVEGFRVLEETLEDRMVPYGDDELFRDLDALALSMSRWGGEELRYVLVRGKPPPVDARLANAIVVYSLGALDRVTGSVVYDAAGKCRVDVNFQSEGPGARSGHYHLLSPGDHTHTDHQNWRTCPWTWSALPRVFNVKPIAPIGT